MNSPHLKTAAHITITGIVQGVGFRPFVYNLAGRLALAGWVLNHSGGVDIEVEGAPDALDAFAVALEKAAPPLAQITSLQVKPISPPGYADFEIRRSERKPGEHLLISPDVATCADCLRELFDPADRRYRYPFINCTNCGPRFTIIEDIPYDRPQTTMRVFPLCAACRAEYEDPTDRRFHAQPNACPTCGPHIWLSERASQRKGEKARRQESEKAKKREGESAREREDAPDTQPELSNAAALGRAKELLENGAILAIKGLGGFHLACDATNAAAVRTLRRRKHRPYKPFAIMVPTLDDVRAYCEVPPEAAALFKSPQCPIVLLERRKPAPEPPRPPIVAAVAPHQQTLGMMIPYTPLHHLLLRDVGRPLVMTSGNVTAEPIAQENAEALRRLAPLADAFLLHNREIYARYDDSVWQVLPVTIETGAPRSNLKIEHLTQPLRRARGYAPVPIPLPFPARRIFATGPLLKNTFCLTRDTHAFLSQHIGNLESWKTLQHYQSALATYQHLFRLQPELVACDLHPDYLTTRFARQYAEEHGLPAPLPIQHHHAHIAACLVDNGRTLEAGPVLGVAFDGAGYGTDGAIWGGEWLVGDYRGFRRAAQLAYLPLPGGDAATRHPWRIAAAYSIALLGVESLPAGGFPPGEIDLFQQIIARGVNVPQTSSMGRLFDAVSALLGICRESSYEAQAAIELEQVAASCRDSFAPYPFTLGDHEGVLQITVAPLFEALLAELARGTAVAQSARRFHDTVVEMLLRVNGRLRDQTGINVVALSGGVFQNRLLLQLAVPRLRAAGFDVLLHHRVPSNDGGISLGQATLANSC